MKFRGIPKRNRNPSLDPFGLCKILGHNWRDGYTTNYKKCNRCGAVKSLQDLKQKGGEK